MYPNFVLNKEETKKKNSKSKNSKFRKLISPEPKGISTCSKRQFVHLDDIYPYTNLKIYMLPCRRPKSLCKNDAMTFWLSHVI